LHSEIDLADVVARPFIAMRNDHQDAMSAGLGVSEYAPTSKSAEEIRRLWQWIQARLSVSASAAELAPPPLAGMRLSTRVASTRYVF
jgi:chromosome partitioning protein